MKLVTLSDESFTSATAGASLPAIISHSLAVRKTPASAGAAAGASTGTHPYSLGSGRNVVELPIVSDIDSDDDDIGGGGRRGYSAYMPTDTDSEGEGEGAGVGEEVGRSKEDRRAGAGSGNHTCHLQRRLLRKGYRLHSSGYAVSQQHTQVGNVILLLLLSLYVLGVMLFTRCSEHFAFQGT